MDCMALFDRYLSDSIALSAADDWRVPFVFSVAVSSLSVCAGSALFPGAGGPASPPLGAPARAGLCAPGAVSPPKLRRARPDSGHGCTGRMHSILLFCFWL